MLAIVGAEYVLNMLPRGTHEYAKLIRPSELAASCREAGLDLVRQAKGWNTTRSRSGMALTTDTSVNYMLAARKFS